MERFINTGIGNAGKDIAKLAGNLVYDKLKLPQAAAYPPLVFDDLEGEGTRVGFQARKFIVIVRQRLKKTDHLITTEEIWKCEGRLLSSTDGRLKDTCLSFAMFWLLLQRYDSYPLYKCSHEKTWRFVRHCLFSGSSSEDNKDDFGIERAFRVIEVELHFLYDYFYTKYYAMYAKGIPKKLVQLCIILLYCWLATMMVIGASDLKRETYYNSYYNRYYGSFDSSSLYYWEVLDYGAGGIDILVTYFVILAMGIQELLEIGILDTSDWCIVVFLCIYVKKQLWRKTLVENLIEIVCHTPFMFKHWK
ncbi:hypothetical protein Ancab_033550 [Ancistrocladus abbreviatus]